MNQELTEVLTNVLVIILRVLLPVGIAVVMKWVSKQIQRAEVSLSQEQLHFLRQVVRAFVYEAEALDLQGQLKQLYRSKRDFVIEKTEEALYQYGYAVDVELIGSTLEEVVAQEMNWDRLHRLIDKGGEEAEPPATEAPATETA